VTATEAGRVAGAGGGSGGAAGVDDTGGDGGADTGSTSGELGGADDGGVHGTTAAWATGTDRFDLAGLPWFFASASTTFSSRRMRASIRRNMPPTVCPFRSGGGEEESFLLSSSFATAGESLAAFSVFDSTDGSEEGGDSLTGAGAPDSAGTAGIPLAGVFPDSEVTSGWIITGLKPTVICSA
jgi:hypothetical protein